MKDASTRASALKVLGNIMYRIDCPNDQELDPWAKVELTRATNECPLLIPFGIT